MCDKDGELLNVACRNLEKRLCICLPISDGVLQIEFNNCVLFILGWYYLVCFFFMIGVFYFYNSI